MMTSRISGLRLGGDHGPGQPTVRPDSAQWTEPRRIAELADGPGADGPVPTGRDDAWRSGTRPAPDSASLLVATRQTPGAALRTAPGVDVTGDPGTAGVERTIRHSADGSAHLFLLNHGESTAAGGAHRVDPLPGAAGTGSSVPPPGGVGAIRLIPEEEF